MHFHFLIQLITKAIVVSFILTTPQHMLKADESNASDISYHITIDPQNPKVALIEASFTPESTTLGLFPGANNHDKRWAKFFSDFAVRTPNGDSIAVTHNDEGSWSIQEQVKQPIIVTYQVNLDHEDHEWSGGIDGAAYQREDGVFYTGRSLFVIDSESRENIKVSFDVADHWKVSTPWQHDKGENTFIAKDYTDFGTAMIFAGTHKEFIIKEGNFEVIFALGNSVKQYQDEFSQLAQDIFTYYVELFGGIPKVGSDDFIKSVVVINSAEKTDGEVVGNNISILLEPDGDHMAQTIARFVLVHEFFHLWNGKSFGAQEENTEWFKEGFSNYYTLKALHHVGFLNDESFLTLFENFFYQRYKTDSGLGTVSMTEGDKKHSNWGVIYVGGMLVSMALDMEMRANSNNENNIDNVMRKAYNTFYDDKYYSMDDIKDLLEQEYGQNLDAFFEEYIVGMKPIPIEQYLSRAGVKANKTDSSLGLALDSNPDEKAVAIRKAMFGQLQ